MRTADSGRNVKPPGPPQAWNSALERTSTVSVSVAPSRSTVISIGPGGIRPSPTSTSLRRVKKGRKLGTVAGPSLGTSGSTAARTSPIG